MVKISPELEQQLKTTPHDVFNLIIRTSGDAAPHLKWFTLAGLQVKQQFRLSPGVAVTGPGRDALKLLNQAWVLSIEVDAPVKTM